MVGLFTICDSSDLQMAFWWQILDMCFQRALWSDAKHESVLRNHPDCSPAITALKFAPSMKIKIKTFHRCYNQFGISSLSIKNPV